jgi:ABC-type antimicrobial peptide transport system permease subunit
VKNKIIKILMINLRLCLIEIWSNRLRSFLTSFGIFLGITSFLINVAFIRGIDKDIRSNMEEIGGLGIITIREKDGATTEERQLYKRSNGLNLKEIEEITESMLYVKCILPQKEIRRTPVFSSGKSSFARLKAVNEHYLRAYNYTIESGIPFSYQDHQQKRNVCIIGKRVSERLFGNEPPVGKKLTFLNQQFEIIGTIKTTDNFSWKAAEVLFPYSLYVYRFSSKSERLDQIPIELTNSDYTEKAIIEISHLLKQKHRGTEDFEIESNQSKIQEMRSTSVGIKVLLTTIAAITLIMGGISIMNIMFAAIGDRIREIGLRKALGAQKYDIFLQFIIEAIMLCFVGGLPGLLLGSSVTFFPQGFFPFEPTLYMSDYILAVMFTIAAGILSGLSPAIKASNMQPVDALRY